MKYTMISTKPGIFGSYLLSGGTSATGAAKIVQEQAMHTVFGLSLSEIALCIGIAGTIATMVFQYLNYKNNKNANSKK